MLDFVNSNSVAGESSLDRLACGLGGKTVLPHIIVTVPQMLQNGNLNHLGISSIETSMIVSLSKSLDSVSNLR